MHTLCSRQWLRIGTVTEGQISEAVNTSYGYMYLRFKVGPWGAHIASKPGSHPAFHRLRRDFKLLECTAKYEKLDESLGSRLVPT